MARLAVQHGSRCASDPGNREAHETHARVRDTFVVRLDPDTGYVAIGIQVKGDAMDAGVARVHDGREI